jgi:hypothetical protein
MRDNWLSNRIFKGYNDIVAHCCTAWSKLVDQPWRIMSIGLRQRVHWCLIDAPWYQFSVIMGRASVINRGNIDRLIGDPASP